MGRFKHSAGTVWVLGLKDARDAEATRTRGSLQPRGKLWFLESADPGAATLAQSHPFPRALLGTDVPHVGGSHLLDDCKWHVAKDVTHSNRCFSVQRISIYGK